VRIPEKNSLTLRQADQARGDFAARESELAVIQAEPR
jgi:hypothetical protein